LACLEGESDGLVRVVVFVELAIGQRVKTYRPDPSGYTYQRIWFLPPEGRSLIALGQEHSDENAPSDPLGSGEPGRSVLLVWDIAEGGRKSEITIQPKMTVPVKVVPNLMSPGGRRYASWPFWPRVEIHDLLPVQAGGWPIVGTRDDHLVPFGVHARRWIYFRFCESSQSVSVVDTRGETPTRDLPFSEEKEGAEPLPFDLRIDADGLRAISVAPIMKGENYRLEAVTWDLHGDVQRKCVIPIPVYFAYDRNPWLNPTGGLVDFWAYQGNPPNEPHSLRRWDLMEASEIPVERSLPDLSEIFASSPDGRLVAGSLARGEHRTNLILREVSSGRQISGSTTPRGW
jgi:hypothetical protein